MFQATHIVGWIPTSLRTSLSRKVTYKIQKWNNNADGFHPILVANARVDWLALQDDDITKKFPILPPLRNPTFVCAKRTKWAVMPAQDVVLLDEVSPDLLVRVLVELVANYWSWPGRGGGGYNPTTPELVSN